MPDLKRIPLSKILIGNRRREIDRGHAAVIGASMKEHGQLQPILVRPTPAAERPFTLVIGGHRCAGAEIEDIPELDAIVVKASSTDAQMMEIAENLHRHDLTVLDRAYFVQGYRELMEEKYGRITPGGDQRAKLALWSAENASGFNEAVADRLGISERSAKRLGQIASNLHPALRSALQGTPVADNQSKILQLVKLEPKKQKQIAFAFREEPDVDRALALVEPAPKLTRRQADQAAVLSRLVTAWDEADDDTRQQFLIHAGLASDPLMSAIVADVRSEAA